jgi:integrase
LKLAIRRKPYWATIALGIAIGYRRNKTAGTWSVRVADGKGAHWIRAIGTADDYDTADGNTFLDFWQAQDRARSIGLGARHDHSGALVTVRGAVDAYEAALAARGGDVDNARRILPHLPDSLANKTVALLAARDFAPWRAALLAGGLSASAINRATACLRAALNNAAAEDERISNRSAWEKALRSLPNATQSRNNVILSEADVRAVVAAAYAISAEFGMWTEVAAVTGARPSQIARLEVADIQAKRPDPRLMMPCMAKGRSRKAVERRPVPVPPSLAAKLAALGEGRPPDAQLLLKRDGKPWGRGDHAELFAEARARAGLGREVVPYSLRHTSVVRQLLAGTPVRVTAHLHDTSVAMLERTYSRYISDHSDVLVRRATLDLSEPLAGENVISLPTAR